MQNWRTSTVRSNASWVMVTWDPFLWTDRHDWKHYLPDARLACGKKLQWVINMNWNTDRNQYYAKISTLTVGPWKIQKCLGSNWSQPQSWSLFHSQSLVPCPDPGPLKLMWISHKGQASQFISLLWINHNPLSFVLVSTGSVTGIHTNRMKYLLDFPGIALHLHLP